MLGCSAAYNLASSAPRREFLRQLDHAAIFLMIAGTYTPFTTCRPHGVWAIGMTAAVWTGALTGAVIKLICPSRIERVSIVAYLGLGWIILAGTRPMRQIPITYQELAKALQILPPHSIHRVTEALERLMEEDAAPVQRGARHQQGGAWRPAGARVLRMRPTSRPVRRRSGRSGRMVVSRRRVERRQIGRAHV